MVSTSKVIAAACHQVHEMGVIDEASPSGRAVVLHDSDITDGVKLSDWGTCL